MALFDLDDDALRALAALLEFADLQALTSISTVARRSCFHAMYSSRPTKLTLPRTKESVRYLLRGLTSDRLAQFEYVELSDSWQLDLLIDCGLYESVRGVRMQNPPTSFVDMADSTKWMARLCEKLPLLTHVTKLDMGMHWFDDLSQLAHMPQLRELELGHKVSSLDHFPTLPHLESLAIRVSKWCDLSGLAKMRDLKSLKVSAAFWEGMNDLPSLAAWTKLRRLEIQACTIESADELVDLSTTLDYLKLTALNMRCRELNPMYESEARRRQPEEWAHNRDQLSAIGLFSDSRLIDGCTLRRQTGLAVTSAAINRGGSVDMLASLPSIEEVRLMLPLRDPSEDFSMLLHLPRLQKLVVSRAASAVREQDLERQQQALSKVLAELSHLRHLTIKIDRVVDPALTLSTLHNLESLALGKRCQFATFDWIRPLQQLRVLKIKKLHRDCDPSGIGSLVGLTELTFRGEDWRCDGQRRLDFLGNLAKMKTLELDVQNFHDLSVLRGMRRLQTLRIVSSPNFDVANTNDDTLASFSQLRTLNISPTALVVPKTRLLSRW